MYTVSYKKKIEKAVEKMPKSIQKVFRDLIIDLVAKGPVLSEWPNFSKLSENEYHCHLNYHWVACWKCEKKSIIIEVYYAGSRENAPY